MFDERTAALASLRDDGEALFRRARFASRVLGGPGSDSTGSVKAALDEHGRVVAVELASDWRSHLTDDRLGAAVVDAVREASVRRLTAWGEAYAEPAVGPMTNTRELRQQVTAITAARMSDGDREAALVALLEVVESVERGLDEVSGRMRQVLAATHIGRSPHREVAVEVTGGGEVISVRCDRRWLREAHEANLSRQLVAAFQAAYRQVAANGVEQLIADSPLGEAQWTMQDPFGFACRFGLVS